MNIDEILREQGKTRYWLAKEINVTYQTITRIANKKANRITIDMIHDIVKVLNCTYDDLFKENVD